MSTAKAAYVSDFIDDAVQTTADPSVFVFNLT